MALGRSTDLSVDIGGDAAGLERAMKSAENATARAQNAAQRYDADVRKLESDLMKLEKSLDDEVTAALDRQHDAMDKAGKGLLVFGAAAAGALALAGREAMQWESAWAGVTKTVDGSEQEMAVLEAQLRGLARTLPATHQEIAAVAEAAGQLGVAREDVAAFTRTMIDLGETTDLSADEAATSIAQFMNVMKSERDAVDNIGSTVVALGNAGASTEAQIMSLSLRLSGAGALMGATEPEVLALASAMADLGIESELGGGAASRALLKLYEHVKNGGPKLETLGDIAGMTGEEFATAFGEDPIQAFNAFIQGLGRIRDSGGNVVNALSAVKITGTQNLQVLLRLAGAGDGLTESLDRANEAWVENVALQEEAAKRYATSEAKFDIAMNSLRDNAIDIGGTVLPAVAALADSVTDLATFFGDLPGPVKATITILAVLAASAALAGGAFLVAVPKVHAFKVAVDGLQAGALKTAGTRMLGLGSILMGPWGIALAAGATALTIFAAKQGDAARSVDALKATLDEQTGAITDNSREWAIKELSDSGALQAAKDLGLNLGLVTDAALGNKDAIAELNGQLDEYRLTVTSGEGAMSARTEGDAEAAAAANELRKALGGTNETLADAKTAWELENEAKQGSTSASASAAAAQAGTTTAWQDGALAAGELGEEVKTLGEELADLAESYLSNRDAQRAVREQLRGVKDKLKELRKEYGPIRDENGKLTEAFKRGTEGGDALAETLDGVAESMLTELEMAEKNGAGQRKLRQLHQESREELREVAGQLGLTKEEARKYINEVLGTPKMVRTRFEQQGIDKALEMTLQLRQAALEAQGTYNLTFRYLTTGKEPARSGVQVAKAGGGWVWGPGGPRDDLIDARLSNGEFVVNAESARRNARLLEAINSEPRAVSQVSPLANDVRQGSSSHAAAVGVRTAPLIGNLTVPVSPDDSPHQVVAAVMYEFRQVQRSGRWGG